MEVALVDFLKKYSTIPNEFINDFFGLYTLKSDTEFIVDLDVVSKWLKMRKEHLMETLKYSYKEHIDYVIEKITLQDAKKHGGQNKKLILLTADAFKRLCMLSRTKKAEEVRTYFITLEKLIDKYKQDIVDGMQKRIKELERNQAPKSNPKKGVIYIFKADKDFNDIVKIGKTGDLKKRMGSHNSSHKDDLEVLFYFETDDIDKVEACVKSVLKDAQYRKYKEIYKMNVSLIKELIDNCDHMILKVKKQVKKFKHTGGFFLAIKEI